MRIRVAIFLVLMVAMSSFAKEKVIDLGESKEWVLELLGKPTSTVEKEDHNGVFLNLYYESENTTYTIDKSKNIVCEISLGSTPVTCYPCSGKNGVDLCI